MHTDGHQSKNNNPEHAVPNKMPQVTNKIFKRNDAERTLVKKHRSNNESKMRTEFAMKFAM